MRLMFGVSFENSDEIFGRWASADTRALLSENWLADWPHVEDKEGRSLLAEPETRVALLSLNDPLLFTWGLRFSFVD